MNYTINKGVGRPLEFKGLQAQYVTYLGIGCVGLLLIFAILYLLGVSPYIDLTVVLGASVALLGFVYRLSNKYGAHGLMKRSTLRSIPDAVTTRSLDERLPIAGIGEEGILSRQGDLTVAFRLTLPEIFTLSKGDFETLHSAWVKALRVLPPHTILHRQDWFEQTLVKKRDVGDEPSFLSLSSDRFFRERPCLEHDAYLFLTKRWGGGRLSTSATTNLLKRGIVPYQVMDGPTRQNFLDCVGQAVRILSDTGLIKVERLDGKAAIERYCFLQGSRIQRDIQFKDAFRIGNNYAQLYTLADPKSLPAACGPWTTYTKYGLPVSVGSTLGQLLDCTHVYSQYILIGDGPQTLRNLERKRLRFQSLSAYSRANAVARDAIDAFLQEAAKEQRLPVKLHANVLVWAETREELRDVRSRVGTALSQIDCTLKEETLGAPQIFWAGIPGNAGDFPTNDMMDTFAEQAVCFLNQETRYRSSISPVGIRLGDRQTGVPVHVDISDEPVQLSICANRNKFILGPSGSGKSFFTNHMVRTYYEQGTHIVLVDVGHSYEGLCKLVGGFYFTCSETQPLCFNPFYGDADPERRESIKTLLLALWKRDGEHFRRSEYVALSEALQAYYEYLGANTDAFPCFDSFYAFFRDKFVPLLTAQKVKAADFDADNFLYVLRPYYDGGEFDTLLNARENLDLLAERFIVFELDQVKDHPILFPVVTIIIMEVFIHKMRRLKGVRKMILIEEAWKAIAREGMADYIRYLFKTVRKFYGEAVVVTQEIEDIISSPIVKSTIINNSDCKILLDQSKYANKFDQVQELLGLTDKEKDLVLSLNKANDPGRRYKEVFISLGGRVSKVYRTEVSPEEYFAYTTEESEKMKVEASATRHGSMAAGIKALVMSLVLLMLANSRAQAQIPVIGIIQTILKKAITAVDLKVQGLQLETMELQNAQKQTENVLSENELTDITGWVQQERDLYSAYYTELWKVKTVLSVYNRVKDVLTREQAMAQACKQSYALFQQDGHFSAAELTTIANTFAGYLDESARNLDQLTLLITDLATQMSDGRRLTLIDEAARGSEDRGTAIQTFTQTQIALSLRRARDAQDLRSIQQLYGIP